MQLFSDCIRRDSSPRPEQESTFAHLDRRSGEQWARVRACLETWFMRYPAEDRRKLSQRFRSGDDDAFHSAYLELCIHELLLRTNHGVTIHPEIDGTSKCPDFFANDGVLGKTIVECAIVTGMSKKERGTEALVGSVNDALASVWSPDFYFEFSYSGTPRSPVPVSIWRNRLECWASTLDYEPVRAQMQNTLRRRPELDLQHDGLIVRVRPIAKRAARGKPDVSSRGPSAFDGLQVTSRFAIRDCVQNKATRYGKVDLPFVVVVNCMGVNAVDDEICDGIFGRDGVWRAHDDRRHTRLSAVLAFEQLFPWGVPRARAWLFHNPVAKIRYEGPLDRLPQLCFTENGIELREGCQIGSILGLADHWPMTDD